MEDYKSTGPVDCADDVDTSVLRGKTAIVTGGANGIGEAYVRALCAVGYVLEFFSHYYGHLHIASSSRISLYVPSQTCSSCLFRL
jgi:hypothetical protein